MWLEIVALVAFAVGVAVLIGRLDELIRVLRRIESRLALRMPLDAEKKTLNDDWHTELEMNKRATHPDIWIHNASSQMEMLQPEKLEDFRRSLEEDNRLYRR